jgi:hypothetical protein
MFDDEDYQDFGNEMSDDDGFETYKRQVEKEFFQALERGEDIAQYLYLPHHFLSEKVREHLDVFLLKEAYKNMFEHEIPDTVYSDSFLNIVITDPEFKKKMLNQMIDYFASQEEFEKCARIKSELDSMTV